MQNVEKLQMSSMYGRMGTRNNEVSLVEKEYPNIRMDISIYPLAENVDVFIRDGIMVKNRILPSFIGKEVDVDSWINKCIENYDSILVITGDTAIHKYYE